MKAIDSRTAATATNGTADICFPRYIELADTYGMHISMLDALKKDFGRIFQFCLCRRTGKRTDGQTFFYLDKCYFYFLRRFLIRNKYSANGEKEQSSFLAFCWWVSCFLTVWKKADDHLTMNRKTELFHWYFHIWV